MKNQLPDGAELEQFLAGELPPDRMTEIASMASSDPLLADALEGFAADPEALLSVPAFDALSLPATNESGVVLTRSIFQTGKFWIATFFGVVLIGAIVYFASSMSSVGRTIVRDGEIAELPVVPISKASVLSSSKDSVGTAESAVLSGNAAQINASADLSSDVQDVKSNLDTTGKSTNLADNNFGDDLLALAQRADLARSAGTNRMVVGVISMEGMKIADYTEFRSAAWSDNGSLNYLQYLQKGLKAMKAKSFAEAEEVWRQILKKYPEDANAVYFMGYTQYLAGDYDKAILFLKIAEKSTIKTFRPDAEFYHAMSLKMQGKKDEAKLILEKIAKAMGPRANEANRELYE